MRFAAARSLARSLPAAAAELKRALGAVAAPDLLVLSTNLAIDDGAESLASAFPSAHILGAVAPPTSAPVTTVLAGTLPGATLESFRLPEPALPSLPNLPSWLAVGSQPSVLVLGADGFGLGELGPLLDAAFPDCVHFGGLLPANWRVLGAGGQHGAGAVGVAIGGDVTIDAVVSHGARTLAAMPVTEHKGASILALSGEPAADVLASVEERAAEMLGHDRPLLLGLSANGDAVPAELFSQHLTPERLRLLQPAVLQRHAISDNAVDLSANGASGADALLAQGTHLQLLSSDASSADEDLTLSLAAVRAAGAPLAGALLLGGASRQRLFAPTGDDESAAAPEPEEPPTTHEEAALRAVVGDVPALTLPAELQLAPLPRGESGARRRSHVHYETSCLALFRPKAAAAAPLVAAQDGSERAKYGGVLSESTEALIEELASRPAAAAPPHAAADLSMLPLAEFGEASLLCPGTTGAFHVFEPRFRLLFQRLSRDEGGSIGIGNASGGTSARLLKYEALPDGRAAVTLLGERRFAVRRAWVQPASLGLKMASVEFVDDDDDDAAAEELTAAAHLALALFDAASAARGWPDDLWKDRLPVDGATRPDAADPQLVSFWLTAVLPSDFRTEWYEEKSTSRRLGAQMTWLRAVLAAGTPPEPPTPPSAASEGS